jgi:hypothetical protein
MNSFYYKTEFKFSNAATSWILSRYQSRYDDIFFHDLDITQSNPTSQSEWHSNLPGIELRSFLLKYNCDASYYGINVFLSNTKKLIRGNPHIDTKFAKNDIFKIKSRFNIMVLGNPADPMVWWDTMQWGDNRLIDHPFTTITGKSYVSKAIPGTTPDERWEFLGKPSEEVINLLTPSAFVRTDCAHTIYTSGQPRLIVTVALDKTLEEILLQS